MTRLFARGTAALLILLVSLLTVGAAYQAQGARADRRDLAPRGAFYVVGGDSLHLACAGSGSPTIVLEAGATGWSGTFAWVFDSLALTTRTCAYDRRGMGWSEGTASPADAAARAQELQALLAAAGETGPFLLAGHSLGGVFIRAFDLTAPGRVAGFLFIDPSHPDQTARFSAAVVEQFDGFRALLRQAPHLARVGLLRATNALGRSAAALPPAGRREARLFGSDPQHLATSSAELDAWDASMAFVRRHTTVGDRPVIVLTATRNAEMPEMIPVQLAMHSELATLSTRGVHRRVDADHFSLLLDPAHSSAVRTALRELVALIRQEGAAE